MRTEARKEILTLTIFPEVLYQYDDGVKNGPHIFAWRGLTGAGPTKQEAANNLSARITMDLAVPLLSHLNWYR